MDGIDNRSSTDGCDHERQGRLEVLLGQRQNIFLFYHPFNCARGLEQMSQLTYSLASDIYYKRVNLIKYI